MAKRKTRKAVLVAARKATPEQVAQKHAAQLHRLTHRFFALRDQLRRDAVETMREIGIVLARGAELLPYGSYGRWLDDELGVGRSAHDMTDAEFAEATRKYVHKRRTVTANMRGHGLRMKLLSMKASLAQARSNARVDDPKLRATLSAELAELIKLARALRQKINK